jgi:hypothetical protein
MSPEDQQNVTSSPETSWETVWKWVERVSWVLAIFSAIYVSTGPVDQTKTLFIIAGLVLVFIGAGLYIYRKNLNHLKSARLVKPLSPTAALRGLLPFEDGQYLPGREHDAQNFNTIVSTKGFRYGVIAGESGCGKTSFLRAKFIPLLRQMDWKAVYVPRPTAAPATAIERTLEEHLIRKRLGLETEDVLKEFYRNLKKQNKKAILIIDQFEEYFLSNPSRAGQTSLLALLKDLQHNHVALIICIRSDFFVRLIDLFPAIEDPTSRKTTYTLRNLNEEQARHFLREASTLDGAGFSNSLIDLMVQNLNTSIGIRPVELQLVATELKNRGAKNVLEYEKYNRADGILNSFIQQEMEYSGDKQVAGIILRSLCAPSGDAKAPQDKSIQELWTKVSGKPAGLYSKTDSLAIKIRKIIAQFEQARIIVKTAGDNYNLFHDYLAYHIQQATVGIESKNERADKLLHRYLAEYKEDSRARIPAKHYRLIMQHASPNLVNLSDSRKLLRKYKTHILFLRAVSVISVLVIAFSYKLLYDQNHNTWFLSTQLEAPEFSSASSTRLVVKSGNPYLDWMNVPGATKSTIETDFYTSDFNSSSFGSTEGFDNFINDMSQNRINGKWQETKYGLDSWIFPIIEHQSDTTAGKTWLLLGFPDKAYELLLSEYCQGELCLGNPIYNYYYGSSSRGNILLETILLRPDYYLSESFQSALVSSKRTSHGLYNLEVLSLLYPELYAPDQLLKELDARIIDGDLSPDLATSLISYLIENPRYEQSMKYVSYLEGLANDPSLTNGQRIRILYLIEKIYSLQHKVLPKQLYDLAFQLVQNSTSSAFGEYLQDQNLLRFVARMLLQSNLEQETAEEIVRQFLHKEPNTDIGNNNVSPELVIAMVSLAKSSGNSELLDEVFQRLSSTLSSQYPWPGLRSLEILIDLQPHFVDQTLVESLRIRECIPLKPEDTSINSSIEEELLVHFLKKDFQASSPAFEECFFKILRSEGVFKTYAFQILQATIETHPEILTTRMVDALRTVAYNAEEREENRLIASLMLIKNGFADEDLQKLMNEVVLPIRDRSASNIYSDILVDQFIDHYPELITAELVESSIRNYYSDDWTFSFLPDRFRLARLLSAGRVRVDPKHIESAFELLKSPKVKDRQKGSYLIFSFVAGDFTKFDSTKTRLLNLSDNSSAPHICIAANKTLEMLSILELDHNGKIPSNWTVADSPVTRIYVREDENLHYAWNYVLTMQEK